MWFASYLIFAIVANLIMAGLTKSPWRYRFWIISALASALNLGLYLGQQVGK